MWHATDTGRLHIWTGSYWKPAWAVDHPNVLEWTEQRRADWSNYRDRILIKVVELVITIFMLSLVGFSLWNWHIKVVLHMRS
jgi:hypothetical protein